VAVGVTTVWEGNKNLPEYFPLPLIWRIYKVGPALGAFQIS